MDDAWRLLGDAGPGRAAALACAAKACGVLAGAWLLALAMRRRAAATRHLIWGLGLAGALALPPMSFALPHWGLAILTTGADAPPSSPIKAVGGERPEASPAVPAIAPVMTPRPGPIPEPAPRPGGPIAPAESAGSRTVGRWDSGAWLLAAWASGTTAVLAWCVLGWAAVRRAGRGAERITGGRWPEEAGEAAERLGMSRRVTLLRGGASAMPLTWGVLRPCVLLPAEAEAWPPERRRAVLLHELAHVRRRDCLTQWLGLAACAAYWFNPLAWWASSRMMAERERACDDLVLEAGERPSDYAAQLLGVARSLRPAPASAFPAAIAMARPSGLETRLLAILDARRDRRAPARWVVLACLAAALASSATLAAVRLVAKERPRPVLGGRVVGPDGKPLGGAQVVVVASGFRWRHRDSVKPTAELLGRGRSDEQGSFRVELSGEPESDEGRVVLVATAAGHGFAARELTDLDATIAEPIRLLAEHPVEVRLVDLEGSPVAGAEVTPEGLYPAGAGAGLASEIFRQDFLPPLASGWTTDREGRFTIRGCGEGHSAFFSARAPGFGKQRLHFEIKAGSGTSTLTLGRAHMVEGRVTLGKDGPPAVAARVESRTMSQPYGIGMGLGSDEVTTDEGGRYRIEAAPGASIVLKVFPPAEGADAYLLRNDLLVPGDSVASHVDFALPKGVLVRGRVLEAATGRPVAGAVVYHQPHERGNPHFIKGNPAPSNPDEQRAVTAADGTFRMGVMPGTGYLLVKGPTADYLHDEISGVELRGELIWPNRRHYPDAFRKLGPKPDEGPIDVEFALRRGVTVHGHLVDPGGQPVLEAVLMSRWYLSRNEITSDKATEKSLRGGRFELEGCDPASSAPVLFLDVKSQRGAALELSGKQAGEDVVVAMKPCGSARVRIVNGQGRPARAGRSPAHLEVVLSPGASWGDIRHDDQKTSPLMGDAFHASNLDVERYRGLATDAEGRMTFPTLIPGATYRVIVFNQKEKTEIEFTVGPGEPKDLGDLMIRDLDRAG